MSTIGTTLKEPRVFAHDAIALNDLTYPPTPAVTFTVVEAGTDYTAATVYDTMSQDGGREANINVVAVGVGGTVTSVDLAGGDGGYNYAVGDLITLTGQGSNNNCIVEVATVNAATGTWSLGNPITPMPRSFNTVPYWDEKTAYTYSTSLPSGPFQTPGPGATLYIGADMDITVINEACTEVEYPGVASGSFLPVSVLSIVAKSTAGLDDVLVLF